MRRWLLAAGLGVVVAFAACSAEKTPRGQVTLVISSNLAPPKDFEEFRVEIRKEGTNEPPVVLPFRTSGSQLSKIPATLAIAPVGEPLLRIKVVASRLNVDRITREAVVRVPKERNVALALPLDGLCIDAPVCGSNETCIAGSCQPVVEQTTLPDYDPASYFGGGTGNGDGTCFDTLDCFSAGKVVTPEKNGCKVPKEPGAGINVGVLRPLGGDGICGANACIIPVDRDPFGGNEVVTGWREQGEDVILPKALCERNFTVMITTKCPTKSAPTCGPWSSVGGPSVGPGAVLPLDGGILGDGGPLPPNVPAGIEFVDSDVREGFVKGTAVIKRAPEEGGIDGYRLYWGDGPNKKLQQIAQLPKTGADVTHPIEGPMLAGSSHLYAVSYRATVENAPHVSRGPIDNFVRQKQITTAQNEEIYYPEVLVDAKSQRLLVVGHDIGGQRNAPAMVRCQLDGAVCQWLDLSNGEAPNGPLRYTGAVIDAINDKLLVLADRGAAGASKATLYRCNSDGSGCEGAKTLGGPDAFATTRVRALVDDVNKKLIGVYMAGNSEGLVVRCDLDGTGCTYPKFATGVLTAQDADAVIDKAGNKLLMVRSGRRDAFTFVPFFMRCEIDGTSCEVKDLLPTDSSSPSSVSIAIDAKNERLLVVTWTVNVAPFHFYRCRLDGTACSSHDLPDPGTNGASYPHIVVDPMNDKIFVFSSGSARATYQRCELDGTACTTVPITTNFGMLNVRATLHDGKFFAIGPKNSSVPGFDFATFLSY